MNRYALYHFQMSIFKVHNIILKRVEILMKSRRKGFIPSQSPNDRNHYKFMYYSYVPSLDFQWAQEKEEYIKKDSVLGTICSENN